MHGLQQLVHGTDSVARRDAVQWTMRRFRAALRQDVGRARQCAAALGLVEAREVVCSGARASLEVHAAVTARHVAMPILAVSTQSCVLSGARQD